MSRENYDYGVDNLWSIITPITVPAAGGLILGANPKRVGVRFSAPTTNRVTITDKINPVLDVGYNVYPATSAGLELCAAIQGVITQKELFGIAAVADQAISVIETFRK